MPELAPPKVILLDGPLAGFLYNVPPDTYWWNVVVPKQFSIIEMMKEPAIPLFNEHVTYTIRPARFDPGAFVALGARTLDIRVGTIGSEPPRQALLEDYVPTGLAEQGLLPWVADPWTTPGRPHATRYVCPLEDWHFDEPTEPPHFEIVGYEARAKDTEAMIRQHLEEHTLDDWVKAATELLKLRQELERGPQAQANRRHADADGWLKGITQVLNTVTGEMVTLPEPIDVHLRDIDRVIDEYQAKFLAEWEAQKDGRAARTASMFGWEAA